jgi:hypothetical protein
MCEPVGDRGRPAAASVQFAGSGVRGGTRQGFVGTILRYPRDWPRAPRQGDAVGLGAFAGGATKRVILRHLARDGEYTVKVGYAAAIWNPQPPPFAENTYSPHDEDMMPGRGRATYSYDTATRTVHLRWEPRDGTPQDFTGPLPDTPVREQTQRLPQALALLMGLIVVCLGGGAAIGAAVSAPSARFAGTMVGVGGGCVAYVIVARVLTASAYFRRFRRSGGRPEGGSGT